MNTASVLVLKPRAAFILPYGIFIPFLNMLVELVRHALLGGPALDVVGLHLSDALDSVFGYLSQRSRDTAIGNGPGRADENNKVRNF